MEPKKNRTAVRRSWLAAGAAFVAACVGIAATFHPARESWDYIVVMGKGRGVDPGLETMQLDSLGSEGWELVSVVGAEMAGSTGGTVFYLRRPLP